MINNQWCIHQIIQIWAEYTPTSIAVAAPDRVPLTYQKLHHHICDVRQMLNGLGIGRNDRVAAVIPGGPEAAIAFIAIASSATIAPLNPAYQSEEFDFYLSDLAPQALVLHSELDTPAIDKAHERGIPVIMLHPTVTAEAGLFTLQGEVPGDVVHDEPAQPGDVALMLHTSGTTSKPKLVPLTHKNLCCSAHNIQKTLELTSTDRCLNIMPLFHIHGLIAGVLSSLTAGASVVCTPGFYAPKVFEWMETFRPTWYTAVPTMHQAILARTASHQEIVAHHTLRFIRSCSSALPAQLLTALEGTFSVPVIEAYGMTEASHQIASNPLPPRKHKAGSVGMAVGAEVAIIDTDGTFLPPGKAGEIVIRGPNVTLGYTDNPTANDRAFMNGWFRTGD